MNKADEKRAFEQMMVEISDSDSDSGEPDKGRSSYSTAADSKNITRSGTSYKTSDTYSSRATSLQNSQTTERDEEIANFGSRESNRPAATQQTDQINVMKRWLLRPCPPGEPPLMCYDERHRIGFGRINPTYKCYLERSDGQGPRFLMAAKKKNGSKTSYYLISLDIDSQDDRGAESVLGKVRGNSVGSQYLITDHGIAPDKAVAPSMLRKVSGYHSRG